MRSSDEAGLAAEPTTSWPSPAQDYYQGPLDLNRALVPRPASTFVIRVRGAGLAGAGVSDGDELVVDRSLSARPGQVVVVRIGQEFRVGSLVLDDGYAALATDLATVRLGADSELWGVATIAIHHLLRSR
jgi:DNA polymerase V